VEKRREENKSIENINLSAKQVRKKNSEKQRIHRRRKVRKMEKKFSHRRRSGSAGSREEDHRGEEKFLC